MKKLLSLIVTLCMVFGMLAVCASAETPVAYLYLDENLHITSTGYYFEGQEETAFVGDYFLYGNSDFSRLYIESEGTYNVTLHNYSAKMNIGGEAVRFNAAATLNLTIKGVNLLKSNSRNTIFANGIEGCTVTLNIAENSSLTFDDFNWYEGASVIDPAITFTMADGSAVAGTDVEGWNSSTFTVENGTPASHANSYFYYDDNTCAYGCAECGVIESTQSHFCTNLPAEGGHVLTCAYCNYEFGEVEAHNSDAWVDRGEECANICSACGYEHYRTEHSYVTDQVEATKYEAAYTAKCCQNCLIETKEYSDLENAVLIEMLDSCEDGWNGGSLAIFENGIPVKFITMKSSAIDYYAIPIREDSAYALKWFVTGAYADEIGIKLYVKGEEEPSFDMNDMDSVMPLSTLVSFGLADYSGLQNALDQIPEMLESYTKESLMPLVEALKTIVPDLPAAKQAQVDAMEKAVLDALEGLEEQTEPAPHGIINVSDNHLEINQNEYILGDSVFSYNGKYILIGTELFSASPYSVHLFEGEYAVDIVNLNISGTRGNICAYLAEVELSAYGVNALVSQESTDRYAGIDIEESHLTINDTDGTLIAVGADSCAGIGSYEWYDEETGEYVPINAGSITVNGGNIYAYSTDDGAGIGGGYYGGFDTITINGGNVYAECLDDDGAGIGAGDDGFGGSIIINGGNITALSLDDDGAGIGGADSGYVEEITINGGTIVVGSDDAAGIGGGQESESFGGKITINGGVIMAHEGHDNTENLIGNGHSGSKEAGEDNFVVINGGAIITGNSSGIYPLPTDSEGNPVEEYTFKVNESLRDSSVTLALSDNSTFDVTAYGVDVGIYLANDVTVTNAKALACDVNGDQAADMFDYLIVKRVYFEVFDYTDFDYACADVDGDGEVTPFDYLNVKTAYFNS